MYISTTATTNHLSQLTGADLAFDALVDYVALQMSRVVGSEQDLVRDQLATFRPHFEQMYEGIVRRHVGDDEMPALRKMLESDAMKRYVHARSAMNESLVATMRELSHRMGETPI